MKQMSEDFDIELNDQERAYLELSLKLANAETEIQKLKEAAKGSIEYQAALESENTQFEQKIAKVKSILGDLIENPEIQCYAENRVIPCQAPCAKDFEYVIACVLAIQELLNNDKPTEEKP